MNEPYEKPTLTYLGKLGPDGSLPREPAYQVGDFVWATNNADGSGTRWLARIDSGHSVRSVSGRRWLVRVRRVKFWTSGAMHMYIARRLTLEEAVHNRQLGLIPPAGEWR